jgi:hypothetical protein
MLDLTSPRWEELTQAYGAAGDVPRLLGALTRVDDGAARAELWFALWRMLHRPDAAYSASYAAVPHLLRVGRSLPMADHAQAMHLASRIEIARREPASDPMPPDLVDAYAAAMEGLPRDVAASSSDPWPPDVARICAAALLVGKRHPEIARELLDAGTAAG